MNNCKEIKRLLSVYADGELSDEEKKTVDQHVNICLECKKALNEQLELHSNLMTMANTPTLPNNIGVIISALTSTGKRKPRVWLRPVLVATPIVLVAAILLTTLLPTLALTPEKVLAKAQAAILNVQSYRAYGFYTPSIIRTQWEFFGNSYHSMNSAKYGDGSEMIIIGEQIYLKGYQSTALSIEDVKAETPSAQLTQEQLSMLTTLEVLPEENIDGVLCFHYRGQIDNEKYFERYLQPTLEKAFYDSFVKMNETRERKFTEEEIMENVKKIISSAKDKYMNKQYNEITWEFWIGKDDYIVRQREQFLNGWSSWIVKYFDFNVPVSIESPLDAQGNLLPGWTVMTEMLFPEFSQ